VRIQFYGRAMGYLKKQLITLSFIITIIKPYTSKTMETEKKSIITGKEGGPIDPHVAAGWTKSFRDKHPGETISHLFGREILESILAQDGCVALRFYHAYDHNGKTHLVISGVNHDGSDQVHHGGPAEPILYKTGDQSTPCPGSPNCPKGLLSDGAAV